MKKKVFQRGLALSALMAFVITGSALAATSYGIKADNGDINGNESYPDGVIENVDCGIYAKGGQTEANIVTMELENIKISANGTGLESMNGGGIELTAANDLSITSNCDNNKAYGIKSYGSMYYPTSKINIAGNSVNISVHSSSVASGILAEKNTDISIEANRLDIIANGDMTAQGIKVDSYIDNSSTDKKPTTVTLEAKDILNLKATGKTYSIGIQATRNYSKADLSAGTIAITGTTDGNQDASYATGIEVKNAGKVELNADKVIMNITNNGQGKALGINAKGNTNYSSKSSVTINAADIFMKAQADSGKLALATFVEGDAEVNIGTADTNSVTLQASNKNNIAYAIIGQYGEKGKNDGGKINIQGANINILADGNLARGVHSSYGTDVVLGSDASTTNIKVSAQKEALGIATFNNSTSTVNGKNLFIEVDSVEGDANGIHVQSNDKPDFAEAHINAENTFIKAKNAMAVMSTGHLYVNSNLYTESTDALVARGNAVVSINEDGKHTTQLNGDINFNYDKSSGTGVDADVKINLSGKDSYWNGNVKVSWNTDGNSNPDADKLNVDSLEVTLSDGAQWNAQKIEVNGSLNEDGSAASASGSQYTALNNLVLNNGIVNLDKMDGQALEVENLKGTGGTVSTSSLDNKVSITSNNIDNLVVQGTGAIVDKIHADMSAANALANVVVDSKGHSTADKITTEEGTIGGKFEADVVVGPNGEITLEDVQHGQNTSNLAITDMSSVALMAWRAENNDMNKRLGELRDSNGEHGIWTRMTRGESEFGAVKNQYNSYQIGYDEKLSTDSRWTVGAAVTYTDGQSSFGKGTGENTHKGLAVYGSYLGEDGSFVDLIAKYARLEHEFDVNGGIGKGDYNTNGYSISAEYGKRFEKGNGMWIEPQVELTYGRVGSADYVTDKAKAHQDEMDSLVGRVGFRLGKDIKQGNIYARASYLYDFEGETSVTMSNGQSSDTYEQDLGGGWFEVGVGTNISLSDATYLYFDVEKTYGGDVATPWAWNVGVRYSF